MLITILLVSQEKNEIITDKDKTIWDSLSADEKWQSFKTEHNAYVNLKFINDNAGKREDKLLKDLEVSTSLLSGMQPKNGLSILAIFGVDYSKKYQEIGFDSYVMLFYNHYYYLGPVQAYLQVGSGIKFFENYGGAVSLGFGFTWK
jgi:hypothetical protein